LSPPLVEVHGLVHVYDTEPALAIEELALEPGRYHLAGPNGAGKSTLLGILATLIRPTQGHVSHAGHPLPDEALAVRACTGFAGHEPSLPATLEAREALAQTARLHGLDTQVVDEALAAWGLAGWARERVAALSHGQRARLDLARALLHEPPVALLDEPASGLDEAARDTLSERLAQASPELVLVAAPGRAPIDVDGRIELIEGRVEASP